MKGKIKKKEKKGENQEKEEKEEKEEEIYKGEKIKTHLLPT